MRLQVLIYEDNAAGFSMLFDDDGEQFRHVIGKFAPIARQCVSVMLQSKSFFTLAVWPVLMLASARRLFAISAASLGVAALWPGRFVCRCA